MNFEMNFLLQPLPQQVERPVIESDAAHSRQRGRTVAPAAQRTAVMPIFRSTETVTRSPAVKEGASGVAISIRFRVDSPIPHAIRAWQEAQALCAVSSTSTTPSPARTTVAICSIGRVIAA